MRPAEPVASKPAQSPPGDTGAPLPPEVYLIGCGPAAAQSSKASPQTMGFKAWNLLRMAALAMPVPPAFVLGTRYCADAAARRRAADPELWRAGLLALERSTGHMLGDRARPLLLSVRSGAPVSMPGMMQTILNVGLCDATAGGLLRRTGNPRLVWDAYRRLVATYAEVVAGLPRAGFDAALAEIAGERDERELDFAELRALTRRYLELYAQGAGHPFPQDPGRQLAGAIEAVFASWQAPKACEYRRLNGISDEIGTAVTVQSMVFGNSGGRSGAGVGFTRDPASGEAVLRVDFLFNAQGEDVVSGRRVAHGHEQLAAVLPEAWLALREATGRIEREFGDMQEFEFTVQDGRLYLLQTRAGKRTRLAAARIALDMVDEQLIDPAVARERTRGLDREALARTRLATEAGALPEPLARAASASSGVASGRVALDSARAAAFRGAAQPFVLVRAEAETDDLAALEAAVGLLTQRGARSSHAAVVARHLGKVCLVGCTQLQIDEKARVARFGERSLREGDLLTLDGNDGACYAGALRTKVEYPEDLLARLAALHQGA
jgi:pyruvate,orthophosphate dikinase